MSCYILYPETIILNLFALTPKVDQISFEHINVLASLIVKECRNSILVSVYMEDIARAVSQHNTAIRLDEGSVVCINHNDSDFRNVDIFNRGTPLIVLKALENVCKEKHSFN